MEFLSEIVCNAKHNCDSRKLQLSSRVLRSVYNYLILQVRTQLFNSRIQPHFSLSLSSLIKLISHRAFIKNSSEIILTLEKDFRSKHVAKIH